MTSAEERRESKPETLGIPPTAQFEGQAQHSDVALTNVFVAHTSLIASERAAIWQRYSALLIAQSIVLATMTRCTNSSVTVLMGIVGIVLCVQWLRMTKAAWTLFRYQLDEASRFTWGNHKMNPITFVLDMHPVMNGTDQSAHQKVDSIRGAALQVIWTFMALYGAFILLAILQILSVIKEPIFG